MEPLDELSQSICFLRQVDPANAEAIWNEYFPRLMRFAKNRFGGISRKVADEEDIALSALNSFFRGRDEGRFAQLTNADELWRLLVTISARKLTAERRRQLADKRGGGKVRGESLFAQPDQLDRNVGMAQIMDESQMPENAEMILKTCEDLLQMLPDAKLRETAILRMEGYTHQEIADRLGCSLIRTKQRVARIKEIWDHH